MFEIYLYDFTKIKLQNYVTVIRPEPINYLIFELA
jgi:hypothetical protein